MKLKLHGNSIRLRLTRSEVVRFAETGRLEEAFKYGPLPSQQLTYGIEALAVDEIGVRVVEARVFILLPLAVASDWTGSDRVGVSDEVNHSGGSSVNILVEKEFRRMHGGKNDPDLYPNPLETAHTE
jgi:hypothetical protein